MSSTAKAELGALYINARKVIPMRQLLKDMGHKQPKAPIKTDSSTAFGVVNNNIQAQHTKAMDMHFHWPCCRESQNQFRYYWWPGANNQANYWTKHDCAAHHIKKCKEILTPKFILNALPWLGIPIFGSNSWDPIGSGIPILFLIPKISVGKFFSNSAVEKLRNWNIDLEIQNSKKK